MMILGIGVVCTFIQKIIFGLTGERLGNSLRLDLFNNVVAKDIAFFDSYRTGDILSRISSDTQVVQEGLTTSVAQVFTSIAKIILTLAFIWSYNKYICMCTVVCLIPSLIATRWAIGFMQKSAVAGQASKGNMSALTEESFSNVKTVKCFATEANHIEKFESANCEVFEHGRAKAYFFAVFFFS